MLELGDRAEDLEEHAPSGGGGVDALVEHHQVDAAGPQLPGQVDEVLEGPAEPVELCRYQLVADSVGRRRVLSSSGRRSCPKSLSMNTSLHPAAASASRRTSLSWSLVDTRPYSFLMASDCIGNPDNVTKARTRVVLHTSLAETLAILTCNVDDRSRYSVSLAMSA